MHLSRSVFILICIAIMSLNLAFESRCQPQKKEIDLDAFIQENFQLQYQDINYEDLYEALYQYYSVPLDLNSADREQIQSLHILSEMQINNFLKYKNENGKLISVYELQAVPAFDGDVINKLLPFIIIDNNNPPTPANLLRRISKDKNSYLLLREERVLENKSGYVKHKYEGSPDKLYARFRSSNSKEYSVGFTMEKDAGEKWQWNTKTNTYGPDFLSFHFSLFNKKRIKAVTVGDYQMQFGQGLILGAGYRFGKGAEPVTTSKRNNLGMRPYTSVLEAGYFRGGAVTYQLTNFLNVTCFYSRKKIDGNLITSTDTLTIQDDYITSIQNSGYHRTSSEIANKNVAQEQVYGGNFSFQSFNKNLHLGLTAVGTKYGTPVIKNPLPYNKFDFSGDHNFTAGVDYAFLFKNFNFFGEYARSQNGGQGLISGFVSSLSAHTEFSMLYRNYDRNFHTLYGKAFGENILNENEEGLFWGIKINPISKWTLAAYFDYFKFPWLKYQIDAPSVGNEKMIRISFAPTKMISLYGQFRAQQNEKNQPDNNTPLNYLVDTERTNYLFNFDTRASESISMRSRLQFSSYKQPLKTTYGYYLMQEVTVEFQKVRTSARIAVFDTDDYDNRQYAYEKDVMYAFSIPSLYGKGVRFYALMQWKISRKVDLWIKYSRTTYRNQTTIGSGYEQIIGNKVTDLKIQCRYIF